MVESESMYCTFTFHRYSFEKRIQFHKMRFCLVCLSGRCRCQTDSVITCRQISPLLPNKATYKAWYIMIDELVITTDSLDMK